MIQTSTRKNMLVQRHETGYITKAIIMFILISFTLTGCNGGNTKIPSSPVASILSLSDLESRYGLRVNLVAVTAAGGFVDVRLKMVDSEKAKALLQDPKNFPALWIADSNITINASDETKSQEIKYQDDGYLYLLFRNTGNALKPGKSVTIRFGDFELEPIVSN